MSMTWLEMSIQAHLKTETCRLAALKDAKAYIDHRIAVIERDIYTTKESLEHVRTRSGV